MTVDRINLDPIAAKKLTEITKYTFLIVDDDDTSRFLAQKLVEPYAREILKADCGVDAIRLVDTHDDIDIIFVDLMMPGMSGYETIAAIRCLERKRHTIIVVTADNTLHAQEESIKAGANLIILKPIDVEALRRYFGYKALIPR